MPYFISMVVICGMLTDFSVTSGLFNQIRKLFGLKPTPFLSYPQYFRAIYIGSNIWQQVGWSSIIYLAALSNIDPQLYEAAKIDGAGRFRQTFAITLPSIAPTIIILLILRLGRLMNVGHEKILLLYNPATYEVADVISTFVYRQGLIKADFSYSTAIGLFNSLINFMLLVSVNAISRKVTETSLW
jgi:putative aldouronate transport system permease protein